MRKTVLGAWCLAFGAGLAGCCCLCGDGDYPETVDEGFVSLFNGKDLSGWYGSKKYGVETIEVKLNNGTVVKQPVIARMEKSVHSPQLSSILKILEPMGYTLQIVPAPTEKN